MQNITETAQCSAIAAHLTLLRTNGLRITPLVCTLLTTLARDHQVYTTNALREELSQSLGYPVSSPTIYRICERLAANGVLCAMYKSDGILRYFLCSRPHDEQHQHFICTRCLRVQEVVCTLQPTLNTTLAAHIDGVLQRNFMQLEGICGACCQ
jgi:Fe2+ or Zn2+ uptake regulation protein